MTLTIDEPLHNAQQIALLKWYEEGGGRDYTSLYTYAVGNGPMGICFDGTYIWVANTYDDTVSKINASTGAVAATITVGNNPQGICFDGAYIWVTNADDDTVSKINASTGTVAATIPVGGYPIGICSILFRTSL